MASSQAAFTPPLQLDAAFVRAAYEDLVRERAGITSHAEWEAYFLRWNELKCLISGERARRDYREAQDMTDALAEARAREMREEILPIAEAEDARVRGDLLASPARPPLEQRYGKLLFQVFETDQLAFAEENIPLNVEAGDVATRYERLLGHAQLSVDGESLTLPRTVARLSHPDEKKRKAAWDALASWTLENAPAFHDHYSQLLSLRQRMALNLKEPNFIPLGYRRMGRLDYGPSEVAQFRQGIKRHVVPLLEKLRAKQAEWLGAPTVKPWNMSYFPGLSLPPGVAPILEQRDRAQALFDRLHPVLGAHFRRMNEEGLIDLENRPGKRPGAYCTSYDDTQEVVIFCNSTGDEGDIGTLTHEMGHAFQAWESRWIEPLELRWPTLEACEVHSMGMEFLALRELETFFSPEDARKFRRLKLIDTLTILPYIAVVDAFQHWVYAHPDHSSDERDRTWSDLWDEYMPGVDFTDAEHLKAIRWKRQAHLFVDPFYYIDYAIAESGALQLWRLNEEDPDRAMQTYLKLCFIGGSQSLQSIFRSANLTSPFDPEVFAPAMRAIADELGL